MDQDREIIAEYSTEAKNLDRNSNKSRRKEAKNLNN